MIFIIFIIYNITIIIIIIRFKKILLDFILVNILIFLN